MANALWITLIGMGLVFIAILLLWGMMALLVRLTSEREELVSSEAQIEAAEPPQSPDLTVLRRRAAAAAVAAALALEKGRAPQRIAEGSSTGGWQSVHRAAGLNRRRTSR